MFPFWESVIAPLVRAAAARRVVEIGALRGENTVLLLDGLAPDAELHVIDPLPEFDPAEHERRFAGRYVFHRDLSLNVLGDCGAFDVALIDGDHNWYTVYNELGLLRDAARKADRPLPVLVLHDVCWPYGRRDLYYDPETIPEEFRQPHRQQGMRPGRKDLLRGGGLNAALHNAEIEGGPRNGVMTALDDFIAEHDRPLRRLVIPIYFGLAVVVEDERLAQRPEIGALLDHFESNAGKDELLVLAEKIRLEAAVFEQNVLNVRDRQLGQAVTRYLELLKGSLLDEQYLENEARLEYLLDCVEKGRRAGPGPLRDPRRFLRNEVLRLRQARHAGAAHDDKGIAAYFPHTAMGRARLDQLERALDTIREEAIDGDLAECGVGRGGGGIFLRAYLDAYELPHRQVWLADTFRSVAGDAEPAAVTRDRVGELRADLNQVREAFERFGVLDDRVRFLQGAFDATLPDAPIERLALLRIGDDVGAAAGVVLDHLYDRLTPGGFVVVDQYADEACRLAVDGFRARRGITVPIERVDWWGITWRKSAVDVPATTDAASPAPRVDRAPLAPPALDGAVDLSVVVVFYNMRREAARTLHSLSRAYQRGVDDVDYEVIVVENGSADDQKLGDELVRGFGPEFRYLDLGQEATPSPTVALNRGIRVARGRSLALMIDGAHVLTPGVLRFGALALRTYQPAVVATQQWYLGPGQQPAVVKSGYDQAYEDSLLETIGWPVDGYRLFEIGHFIGERDWFDGLLESNCLFVPRSLLQQVGGFDDSFSVPGGGYANLELYERLASSPDVTVATILGEGSFHQMHGGTTTNNADLDDRRSETFSYGAQYQKLRGRVLTGPTKPIHYVGALSASAARRTRSRRMSAPALQPGRIDRGEDGRPVDPVLVPDELKTAFIEAFWNGLAWTRTTWLGRTVPNAPTDLVVYQELLAAVRPDWVIETGTGGGGRALFLASICELLGHGQVLSVDGRQGEGLPVHPRLRYVRESSDTDAAFERVGDLTGSTTAALVVIGSRSGFARTVAEFEGYAPFVGVGSYVVVEDTIVNGHPVWPGFGPGPGEAVRKLLSIHGEFVQDTSMEKFTLTFNPGGFLKRIS